VQVQEIITRPQDGIMTVQYNLLDDAGEYVTSRTVSFKDLELPTGIVDDLSALIAKVLGGLEVDEGLKVGDGIASAQEVGVSSDTKI